MTRASAVWTVLALVGLLVACGHKESVASDVVVSIDGELIVWGHFEQYLRANVGSGEVDLSAATLSSLFDQYLDEQLLVRLAIEGGLVDGDIDQRQALAYLLRDASVGVTRSEIEAFYRAHLGDYSRPERVRLRQILASERAPAEAALRALDAGEDFAQVAARLSEGPKAHLGGDQGILSRDDLPPKFVDTIFALEPGEHTDVIAADYGYLVFQVTERQPARTMLLEAAEPDIRRRLGEHQIDLQIGSLVQDARERYNVDVFPQNLPFDYQGAYATTH